MELSIEGCSSIAIHICVSGKFVLCRQNTLLERMVFHIDKFLLRLAGKFQRHDVFSCSSTYNVNVTNRSEFFFENFANSL